MRFSLNNAFVNFGRHLKFLLTVSVSWYLEGGFHWWNKQNVRSHMQGKGVKTLIKKRQKNTAVRILHLIPDLLSLCCRNLTCLCSCLFHRWKPVSITMKILLLRIWRHSQWPEVHHQWMHSLPQVTTLTCYCEIVQGTDVKVVWSNDTKFSVNPWGKKNNLLSFN